jgi:hypothetical protein
MGGSFEAECGYAVEDSVSGYVRKRRAAASG